MVSPYPHRVILAGCFCSICFNSEAKTSLMTSSYLNPRNFRAYKFSHAYSARKLEIFARINFRAPLHFQISITCYVAIEAKDRGQFCKNLIGKYFRARNCKNSVPIFAQFRANPGFARNCVKISMNMVECSERFRICISVTHPFEFAQIFRRFAVRQNM